MSFLKDLFTTVLYQPLFNALIFVAWLIPGHSIGWAIIALTIIIRLILLPSTIKTLEQQQRIKALQPKMNELKKKHGEDKAAHNQAVMELYAAEKVSPFGGCLPTLIQIPLLLVLYRVFIHGLNTDQFNLLYRFTPHMDSVNTLFFGLDLSKPERWVLPVVVALLQFVQIRQTTALTPSTNPGQEGQDISNIMTKQMAYIFPVVAFMTARNFPAALALYYATFSLFMIIQQYFQLKMMNAAATGQTKATEIAADGAVVAAESPKKIKEISSETKSKDGTVTVRRKSKE